MEPASRFAVGSDEVPAARRVVPRGRLFERLNAAARMILVSAPAGSGKTMLVRSWISETGLRERAAWVAVADNERDPQHFAPTTATRP